MEEFGGSLARPLGVGDAGPIGPIEPPETLRPPTAARAHWAGLGAFAIVGATSILLISGVGDAPVSDLHLAWATDKPDAALALPADAGSKPTVFAVPVDGVPALGASDAKVTLVIVTDYACAACDRARGMLETLRGSYGADLRIVFKPKADAPEWVPSSVGACAAAMQGEFERFDHAMWRAGKTTPPGDAAVARAARELGLDPIRFAADSKRCAAIVAASARELGKLGTDVASYFVNGRLVDPWGLDMIGTFQSVIDEELVKARRRIAAGTTQSRYYREWVLDLGQTTR